MASLESGVGYFQLDTARTANVPELKNRPLRSVFTLSEQRLTCKPAAKPVQFPDPKIAFLPQPKSSKFPENLLRKTFPQASRCEALQRAISCP